MAADALGHGMALGLQLRDPRLAKPVKLGCPPTGTAPLAPPKLHGTTPASSLARGKPLSDYQQGPSYMLAWETSGIRPG